MNLLEIASVDFDVKDQLLIRYSAFFRYWRKCGSIIGQYIKLVIDLEKAYESVKREVL
jgi:hypothetical protein